MKRHLIAMVITFLTAHGAFAGTDEAVRGLIGRILPKHEKQFVVETIAATDGKDVFEIAPGTGGKIVLRGNNTLSQCVAFNHYLKYTAHVHVSWYADAPVAVPAKLPPVTETIRRETKLKDRFFLNYCTFGYTMPWWNWRKWERLIDWMALNGVNMPLAQGGTEAVWQKVWQSYGLTDDEIRRDFFTGPAHLPWNRMANIDNLDSPLPQSYIDGQLALTKRIVERERTLGMKPILPAFAGHVPVALKRIKPGVKLTELEPWPGFDCSTATHFIDPGDPLIREIQMKFLSEQERLLGTDHLYGTDPFNEMKPPSLEPAYLAGVAASIYQSMAQADASAVWVQMAWTFADGMWTPPRLKAMIDAVPKGRMVLLDYYCEGSELYPRFDKFFGAPTIWNYLGNFGGNTHLVAPLNKVNQRITQAMNDSKFPNLSGVGATLEGLNNQYAYEFVLERAWSGRECDLKAWFLDNARAHCGGSDPAVEEAWEILRTKVLVDDTETIGGHGVIFQTVPRLVSNARRGYCNPSISYSNADLIAAWSKLLAAGPAARANPSYQFDLAEITRQAIGNSAQRIREQMLDAYNRRDASAFKQLAAHFMEMGRDLDRFLGCRLEFLLGTWINDARSWGKDAAEADYYERNARQLVSTWAKRDSNLTDYSSRCWNGMLSDYYLGRWNMYLKMIADDLDGKVSEPKCFTDMEEAMKDFEWKWAQSNGPKFQAKPKGNVFKQSKALFEKYATALP